MKYKDYEDLFGDKYIKIIFKLLINRELKTEGSWYDEADGFYGAEPTTGMNFYEYFDWMRSHLSTHTAISRKVLLNNPGIKESDSALSLSTLHWTSQHKLTDLVDFSSSLHICTDEFYSNTLDEYDTVEHSAPENNERERYWDQGRWFDYQSWGRSYPAIDNTLLRNKELYKKHIDLKVFIDNPPIKWDFSDAIQHNPNFDKVIMRNVIDNDTTCNENKDSVVNIRCNRYSDCIHQYHPIYSFIKDRFICTKETGAESCRTQSGDIQQLCDIYDDSFTIQSLKCIIYICRPNKMISSLNWYQISKHKNITWIDIVNNRSDSFMWSWAGMCENPNIIPEMLEMLHNSNIQYDWKLISNNPNLTMAYILKNKNEKWDWLLLSSHPNIDVDSIFKNEDLPWLIDGISANPTLKIRHVIQYLDKSWNWKTLSKNIQIDSPNYFNEPTFMKWDYKELSVNKSILLQIVKEHINKDWDWVELSKNPAITLDMIEKNEELPWNWWHMSKNPNLTWEFVKQYIHKTWNPFELTKHKNFTLDIIYNNLIHSYALNTGFREIISDCCYCRSPEYCEDCQMYSYNKLCGTYGADNIIHKITENHPQINSDIFNSVVHFGEHTLWNVVDFIQNDNFNISIHGDLLIKYIPKTSPIWKELPYGLFPIEFIINNIDCNWDWECISTQEDLTFDIVCKTLQFSPKLKTNKSEYIIPNTEEYDDLLRINQAPPGFSKRKNRNMDADAQKSSITITNYGKETIIEQYTSWNWSKISEMEGLTWKDILGYSKYIPWDWNIIMKRNLITEEIIRNYSLRWAIPHHKPIHAWDPYHMCVNINISHGFIIDYMTAIAPFHNTTVCADQSGGYCQSHQDTRIDIDNVINYTLQHHRNLDSNRLKKCNDLSTGFYNSEQIKHLSKNNSIDIDYIANNMEAEWSIEYLCDNDMEKSKEKWINKQRLYHIKALQIQKHWRYYSCNPEYKLAQTLLLRLLES